ncbi:MAG: glycosyltransferase, partial [Gemmatimonadota bacterium]|nr:glycosyltransferase [Gemmatimonadota bacterium]
MITPWLTETIRRLRAEDVEVEVLAPAYRGSSSQVVDGVRVHRFRYAPARLESLTHDQTAPDRIRERPIYLSLVPGYVLAGTLAAVRLTRSGRFDIVHVFWPIPHGLFGVAARRISGLPLVCTFFGVELTWLRKQFPLLRTVLKRIVRDADAVTAISAYTAAQLQDQAPHARPAIIPFGAAVEPQAGPTPKNPPGAPFQLLFVGRLVERKGVRFLLDAVAELRSTSDVHLEIVGDGPLRAQLQEHAQSLDIADLVGFRGSIPR